MKSQNDESTQKVKKERRDMRERIGGNKRGGDAMIHLNTLLICICIYFNSFN